MAKDKETLMDVAAEYREALVKLGDSDLPDEVINDTLEGMKGALEVKATSLAGFAERLDGEAAVLKKRADLIAARAKAVTARADRIRAFVFNAMKLAEVTLIETTDFKIRRKKGAWKLIVDTPTQVPNEFMRFPDPPAPEIDKAKALATLSDGKTVLSWCHREQGEHLEVK